MSPKPTLGMTSILASSTSCHLVGAILPHRLDVHCLHNTFPDAEKFFQRERINNRYQENQKLRHREETDLEII